MIPTGLLASAMGWGVESPTYSAARRLPPTCVPPCLTSDPSVAGFLLHWGEFQTAKLSTALSPYSSFFPPSTILNLSVFRECTMVSLICWLWHILSLLPGTRSFSSSIWLTPQPCAVLGVCVWAVVLLRQSFDCVLQSTLHTHSGWVYLCSFEIETSFLSSCRCVCLSH